MRIFITGITRGMGFAIANKLASQCELLLGTSKTEPDDNYFQKTLKELCPNFHYKAQNLNCGRTAAINLASWAESITDSIDCLILNAGFYTEGELLEFSEEAMRENLEVNFVVNHFLMQSFTKLIENSSRKRIIIIGSTAAYEPYPLVPSYGIAKWALRGLAVNMRKELAHKRIGVTFLSPGATWTDMWAGEDLPRNRLLEPTDIAELIASILQLSEQAVVEEIIIRSMEGDFHE